MDLLDKMATYVRVVEAGSFSAAGKQLRISSGAVSRQISALEGVLRRTLLRRTTRRMEITAEGRRYYEACLRVLREVEEAQTTGRGAGHEGPLQITAPVTFGLERVVPHMAGLMTKNSGLRVDLRLEDRLLDLALEGVDVAIRVGTLPARTADVIAHPLATFHRLLVASPAYLKRRGEPKTPEALAKHDALTYALPGLADTWTLHDEAREASVRLNVVFRSNAPHAVRELATAGVGIGLLPEWLVTKQTRSMALRVVLPAWRSAPVNVCALHRTEHRGTRAVRALVEHLRAAYLAAPPGTLK
ncbi:MAG: LysR family transcriptional regulator [Polyangiaceae bacterium]|jgi:DNA-binding transcriptional LysR family regulator